MAVEIEIHALPEGLAAEQHAQHAHDFCALLVYGGGIKVVDLLIDVRTDRMRERARILGEIEVVSVSRVVLADIDAADVEREGFGGMSPGGFIDMFCRAMKCAPDTVVTRLEFRLIPGTGGQAGEVQ